MDVAVEARIVILVQVGLEKRISGGSSGVFVKVFPPINLAFTPTTAHFEWQ